MKKSFVLSLLLFLCFEAYCEVQPSDFKYGAFKYVSGSDSLPYRLFIPKNYNPALKYPLVVFLHGSAECGNDNEKQISLAKPWGLFFALDSIQAKQQCFVLAPQCLNSGADAWSINPPNLGSYSIDNTPVTRTMLTLISLINSLKVKYKLDTARLYICGLSLGGFGTWDAIERYPNYFAKAVPMSGAGDPSKASLIKNLGIWIFHGALDGDVPVQGSRDMNAALKAVNATDEKYTEYQYGGHVIWTDAESTPGFADWLFSAKNQSLLTISPTFLNYSQTSGNKNITVASNVSWTASSNQSWLDISPVKGSNNGVIKTSASSTNAKTSRTATITINGGGITQTILVTQFPARSSWQNNLGQECGCPTLDLRPKVTLGSKTDVNGVLNSSLTLYCDTTYILDKMIWVPNGKTLTVKKGTVILGNSFSNPSPATALIIERGAKIIADGSQNCPIVFTSKKDSLLDGSYSLTNVGDWGGLVILGTASNNLTTANIFCAGTNGLGYIEGFNSTNPGNLYGAGDAVFPTFNDNDNSGILRFVSIRHAGIASGIVLNGLSLGSVGRGTTIEHVEIVASAGDNIEILGGTVNVKYISSLFGDDDMFDYDLGWKGKAQFLFGIAGDSITGLHTTDNGFEADGDDEKIAPALRSHPVIYNTTLIGNGHILPSINNTGPAAIQARELTEGEIYNSVFMNFRSGLHLAMARSNATYKGDAYDNWTNTANSYNSGGTGKAIKNSLIIKNNTFIGFGTNPTKAYPITKGSLTSNGNYINAAAASAADIAQFTTTDGNTIVSSVVGFDFNWAWDSPAHNSYLINPFLIAPVNNITTTIAPPADGFFSVVKYRGAFDAKKPYWISEWAINQIQTYEEANPTDLNKDGVTDVNDFNIFISRYGKENS